MAEIVDDAVYQEVVRWLNDHTGVREDVMGPWTVLRDLVEDSLEYVEVVMSFEDQFGADVRHPTTRLDSVADLVTYVRKLRVESKQ